MRRFLLACLPFLLASSAWCQIVMDAKVSVDRTPASATVASPAFSTASANELLLAFISADYLSGANTTVKSVAGAGLTWALVKRTNTESGSAEIWSALAPAALSGTTVTATLSQSVLTSMTVMSFTGASGVGASASGAARTGAPTATLVTTAAGSWVFGVGNDFDNAIARNPGTGQSLVHQDLTSTGDTYWVQMQNGPNASAGISATLNDTTPTGDRYNFSICEVLPATTSAQTFSLSGAISPSSTGAGTAVALTGTATGNTTADSAGNFSFAGLANGSYTVTPSKSGYAFTPSSQAVNISGANVSGTNFTAQSSGGTGGGTGPLAIDATVSVDQKSNSKTVITPAFSTAAANELLLAFVATDYLSGANTSVTQVTGAGLTWALVKRTNTESGSAEIWSAFSPAALSGATVTATLSQSVQSSMTVMSFSGANGVGASVSGSAKAGAPGVKLVTTGNGSWVFGVGNDFDNAIARTPGAGQSLIHQELSSAGDTYWVQKQNGPTAASGTSVAINDTAPSGDQFNLTAVEVLAASSGSGTGGTPPSVTLTAPTSGSTLSGKTTVAATASSQNYAVSSVQFTLDGTNLGSAVTSAPYSVAWDTTLAAAGSHTLGAVAVNTAGLSATASPVTVTVDNSGTGALIGNWSAPVQTPAVAVNLILLPNNKLLFYQDGASPVVWDYINQTFASISTSQDIFCSGQALLADGRLLVVGGYGGASGDIGLATAEIFDPATNAWTSVPKMSYKRWYPTATTLSDGRVLVTAGWQTTDHSNAGIPEIFDPATNTWTKLANANNAFETYPFIFQLSDGRVIHVGGSEYATVTDILDLTAQTWSVVDANIVEGGSARMYLPDMIMKAGSAADSQMSGPSANTTYVLDMTQPSPAWKQTASMVYPRSFFNLTSLPDGTVLATGGETDKNGGDVSKAVYAAELWSPVTQTWTTMASMHTPREYHSTALLLPDGRVLQSGMGADFGNVPNETSAEFFSPPYLFKGARPTVTQAPHQIQYGGTFTVTTPDAASIGKVVLIRTGAATHAFDQNTRYVPLSFQQTSGGLTVTAPGNGYMAPPGYYMLFLVNSAGVPAVAPFLQLTAGQ